MQQSNWLMEEHFSRYAFSQNICLKPWAIWRVPKKSHLLISFSPNTVSLPKLFWVRWGGQGSSVVKLMQALHPSKSMYLFHLLIMALRWKKREQFLLRACFTYYFPHFPVKRNICRLHRCLLSHLSSFLHIIWWMRRWLETRRCSTKYILVLSLIPNKELLKDLRISEMKASSGARGLGG